MNKAVMLSITVMMLIFTLSTQALAISSSTELKEFVINSRSSKRATVADIDKLIEQQMRALVENDQKRYVEIGQLLKEKDTKTTVKGIENKTVKTINLKNPNIPAEIN